MNALDMHYRIANINDLENLAQLHAELRYILRVDATLIEAYF